MFVSLSATHGVWVNSGADWLSQSAIPSQKAGCSWKFQVPAVPAWFGRTCGSLGNRTWYRVEFPAPAVFE